jgi:hypothetical protein
LLRNEVPTTRVDVIDAWQRDAAFRDFFLSLLRAAPHASYFWETPPLVRDSLNEPFEFVLVNGPELTRFDAEPEAFRDHFETDRSGAPMLRFSNLGGDATLVVPRPIAAPSAYAHLAAFVRGAPVAQQHALWQATATAIEERIGDRPIWVSTAGLGVAWLHLRIDSRPKYYRHSPYTRLAPSPGSAARIE